MCRESSHTHSERKRICLIVWPTRTDGHAFPKEQSDWKNGPSVTLALRVFVCAYACMTVLQKQMLHKHCFRDTVTHCQALTVIGWQSSKHWTWYWTTGISQGWMPWGQKSSTLQCLFVPLFPSQLKPLLPTFILLSHSIRFPYTFQIPAFYSHPMLCGRFFLSMSAPPPLFFSLIIIVSLQKWAHTCAFTHICRNVDSSEKPHLRYQTHTAGTNTL